MKIRSLLASSLLLIATMALAAPPMNPSPPPAPPLKSVGDALALDKLAKDSSVGQVNAAALQSRSGECATRLGANVQKPTSGALFACWLGFGSK